MKTRKKKAPIAMNKWGIEKPLPQVTRLFRKQRDKIEKYTEHGEGAQFIRDAIDAYTPPSTQLTG